MQGAEVWLRLTFKYLLSEILFGDFHDINVSCSAISAPVVGHLLPSKLLQNEEKKLVVVPLVGEVASKYLWGRYVRLSEDNTKQATIAVHILEQ